MNRRQHLLIAFLAIAAAGLVLPSFSSATFVSGTVSTGTVSASADWTPPTVSVQDPGAAVKGTTTIAATAADAESGIQGVTIQFQPAAGGAWTTICTTTNSPYSCAWDTTARTDGAHLLRAIATDRSGYSTTSGTVGTTVANSLTVVVSTPAEYLRGNVPITTTITNANGLAPVVQVEYSVPGSGTWSPVCSNLSSPYGCTAATTGIANGAYDVRSVAVVGNATYTSATVRTNVDNQAPAVTMTNPGSPLTGTKIFGATASDANSGIDQVVIQFATGSTWSTLCTIDTAPYSCSYDTSTLPNGTYSFRAVATDRAGNTTTSASITNRTVTNVVTSVSLTDPGPYVRGTVVLKAAASSTGTIASVKIQRSPAGADAWTDICTDASTPYACSWATTGVADGSYDLRALATDSNGKTTASDPATDIIVDNTGPTGVNVQAVNGTGTANRIDAGDVVTFTYSEQMNLTSILSGWDGSAISISGVLSNGNPDTLVFDGSGSRPRLGTVELNANFVTGNPVTIGATMTASTTTVNGVPRTVITVKITSGSSNRTPNTAATMAWIPLASVTDLAGNPVSTAKVTESGTQDKDF